jgi:branched-chain amino acid transport system substrate-binding protein
MRKLTTTVLAAAMALGTGGAASAQTQGVSDNEVIFGSVNDLSGIFAAVGVPAVNGANMRFEEANAAGGVHGRMIKFIVEDNGYQIPRAMQGYNKLLNNDKVFAMVLSLGTPMNIAGFKLLDPKGIPNISPLSAAREMLQEPIRTHFTGFSSYWDQVQAGVTYLAKEKSAKTICTMYIPSDFGKEIAGSTVDVTGSLGLTFGGETTHKPDELDFVGSLQKLNAAGCEVITMALGVRQGITVVGTAKKLGLTNITFMNTSAGFLEPVAMVPGGVTDGLYASSGWEDLYSRAAEPAAGKFIADYKAKYDQPASMFAMLGYAAADLVVRGLEAAGPDLTHDSFIAGIESLSYRDELTGADVSYGPDDHQGGNDVVISVVKDGGWHTIAKQ